MVDPTVSMPNSEFSIVVISDERDIIKAISSAHKPVASLSYAQLMKSSDSMRSLRSHALGGSTPQTRPVIWVDLPRGGRMRATKMGHVENLLNQIVSTEDFRVICVIPFLKTGLGLHIPHQRWKQLLSQWKPTTATYCSCQLNNNNGVHHRLRIFCSGIEISDQMCSVMSVDTTAPDLQQTRYFIRAWIHKVLEVACSRTDNSSEQLLVYPHRTSTFRITGYSSNRQTQLPSFSGTTGTQIQSCPTAPLEVTAIQVLHTNDRTKHRHRRGNLLVEPTNAYPTDSRERQKAKEK